MNRLILAIGLLAAPAFAQTNHFVSTSGDVALSAAATAVTLQQPATNGRDITLESATVYCSVAATVTFAKNATTAATATAGTVVAMPGNSQTAPLATFWTASNVSGQTTLRVDHIPAGGTFTYSFPPGFKILPYGTLSSFSISIASLTGTCNISIQHAEPQ